ncbi:MAG: GTP cyclohydrolase I FolE [Thermomicrobiaceae bacterium]|nr:GTP cyclohydrolase I FolE [Thermomicrobiaceae bacterium]
MDRAKLEAAVTAILEAVGADPSAPELARTPARAASTFEELLGGLALDPLSYLRVTLPVEHGELVILRDVAVRSMCEHHLVPMVGVAHVGYLPSGRIVGFDRIVKAVDALARRPQVQERLTRQIADALEEALHPAGVAVLLELEQMCMTIRGVRQRGSRVVTTAYRGVFADDPARRAEFLASLRA